MENAPKMFVTEIGEAQAAKLAADLPEKGFTLATPQYTHFQAKKEGISLTAYLSGKLVVQGKGTEEFVRFYLEPEVLGTFGYGYQKVPEDITPRAGVDESGKGDFFGPLCVAAVYAGPQDFEKLMKIGVKDSKQLSDRSIHKMAEEIRRSLAFHEVKMGPMRYNELYSKFGNLNHLLAWGHATAIEAICLKTSCAKVIVDQFANERLVLNALKKKKVAPQVTQRTKAEEDPVVAAASILARDTFVRTMEAMSEHYGVKFPKGGGRNTVEAAKIFAGKYGRERLNEVCKLHFKLTEQV